MIIWINGAFGAGKSTVACLLHQKLPNSILYDPELLGDFLQAILPKSGVPEDFQDYLPWRQATIQIIRDLVHRTNKTIIVPMTIYKKEYYQEIIEQGLTEDIQVQHIILMAAKDTILDRLDKRSLEDNTWARNHLESCLQAFENDIPGQKIRTDKKSPEETVTEILKNKI